MTETASKALNVVRLPEILDLKAASPLRQELLASRGRPVDVDASRVQRLGGLCLQVLIAAHRAWSIEGTALRFVEPSTEFLDGLTLFGAASLTAQTSGGSL